MMERWNKFGTNSAENKKIAEEGFNRIDEKPDPYRVVLDDENKEYIDAVYPKTDDDFRNEEISKRRVIEGPDVYQKLNFNTEEHMKVHDDLLNKRNDDYNKVWNAYTTLIEKRSDDSMDSDHKMAIGNLRNLEATLEPYSRFNLRKGEPLTANEINDIKTITEGLYDKIGEIDQVNKEYNNEFNKYGKLHQSLKARYEPWDTDPNFN